MATYRTEMLAYRYELSLHIHHESMDPEAISDALGREPLREHSKGQPRKTPSGRLLKGFYPDNYWTSVLPTTDQVDLEACLHGVVEEFAPHREFLIGLASTGGEVCLFLGVFAEGGCAYQFGHRLLYQLSDLGFDLRVDYYCSE